MCVYFSVCVRFESYLYRNIVTPVATKAIFLQLQLPVPNIYQPIFKLHAAYLIWN